MPKILDRPKERILEETTLALQRGGYEAVYVRTIARLSQVSVGTVYNYFPSKEALVAECLLADWKQSMAAAEGGARDAQEMTRLLYDLLTAFYQRHLSLFQDAAVQPSFAHGYSRYHAMLRGQLAEPLRPLCQSDFAADFIAEALLTWTVAGKEFSEIWGMFQPLFHKEANL